MRDKLIGLVLVGLIVGLIWFVGAKLGKAPAAPDAGGAGGPKIAHVDRDAEADAAGPADAAATEIADAGAEVDATLALSPACQAMKRASQRYLDEARDAGFCVGFSAEMDHGCKTSANGATWGVRIDDVTDLEPDAAACPTGWLMRVVHVAADGSEQTIIPPGPGGVRNGHRYNVFRAAPVDATAFFDWDGDGDDEVVIQRWTSTFVYTFKHGRIVPYAPASHLHVVEAKDVDGDGRPDLLVAPFGDAPTTIELLAHSLPDGAFTLHDALAVEHAQKLCKSDAPVALGAEPDVLANDIACSLVWGHDPTDLRKQLCAGAGADAGACTPWAKRMLATKPPLSLR